jgi:hypothetical protein
MKHAGQDALARLEPLLVELRRRPNLREKKLGIFYRKSKSFLHFHEDPTGLFADVRLYLEQDFYRFPVNTDHEQKAILDAIDNSLTLF